MSDMSSVTAALPAGYTIPASTGSTSSSPAGGLPSVNANTFLQLLVAQLQYQDPSNPTDSTQFLSQTAQFQEVEQLTSLEQAVTQLQTSLSGLAASQQAASASSLLGQQVSGTTDGGQAVSGVVTAVSLSGSAGPVLTVNGTTLPLSGVKEVARPAAT